MSEPVAPVPSKPIRGVDRRRLPRQRTPRPPLAPEPAPAGPRTRLRALLREPLLQFGVIGVVICGLTAVQQRRHDLFRIVVTPGRAAQIARKYTLQFGAAPDPATLERLVRADLHDEVLFRQGWALGLDRDDEIVRRRVIQKAQFLLQAAAPTPEPTPRDLAAYAAAHADRYRVPARASFSHVFFAVDREGGVAGGEARARAALARTSDAVARAPEVGDPFPDLYDFAAFEPEQVARLFGRTPFATAVFDAPVGRWTGPFRSAYGWHLLRVSARSAARTPHVAETADRVRADVVSDAQARADDAAYQRVARRFTVVRADRGERP